ncbi:hypothetical protein CEXT_719441 [Caerostris extrusa]|uniref:Uncharacterized protein n=1 Tax=Caerostris extrusa TaxID=172846 RepID=A0AAV4U1D6_CAEEX|nr:hypothetical protein CEXT_719441 [Caerostris extrusa]
MFLDCLEKHPLSYLSYGNTKAAQTASDGMHKGSSPRVVTGDRMPVPGGPAPIAPRTPLIKELKTKVWRKETRERGRGKKNDGSAMNGI